MTDDDFDPTVVRVTVPCFLAVTVDIPTSKAKTLGDGDPDGEGSNNDEIIALAVDAANKWWEGVTLAPDDNVTIEGHDTEFYVALPDGGDVGAFRSLTSGWMVQVGPLESEVERDVSI